jgi:hypothetical protein
MTERLRPVIHPGVRRGLLEIRRRRGLAIALSVGGWPTAFLVGVLAGPSAGLGAGLLWVVSSSVIWMILWWTRCPRCENLFSPGLSFYFLGFFAIFRRRCHHCGLDIRQLG